MKIETSSERWIFNGKLELFPNEMHGHVLETPVVYEVIRIKEGIPVFMKAHFDRLKKSLILMFEDKEVPSWMDELEVHFMKLIKSEEIINQNIKIIVWNLNALKCNWCIFPITSYYPEQKIYLEGVQTDILKSERNNPSAKLYHDALIETVNVMRKETGVFEVLLIDRNNCLTEGSRSNLFFVKEGKVFTAPESDILHGITRKKLKSVLIQAGIECIEKPLIVDEIDQFEGAFITGTSIHVLPVKSIGTHMFDSATNKTIKRIIDVFEASIEEDHTNV